MHGQNPPCICLLQIAALYFKMNNIAEFEKDIIRQLCEAYVSHVLLEELFNKSVAEYEYSGSGYFLTIRHSELPAERTVCDKPKLLGQWGDIDSGFIVFLENNELTLECHSWGDKEIPSDYRKQPVKVVSIEI